MTNDGGSDNNYTIAAVITPICIITHSLDDTLTPPVQQLAKRPTMPPNIVAIASIDTPSPLSSQGLYESNSKFVT